ncbi:hypothetical protein Q0590_37215 [Rhodocytophaga aerolata]|uniref:DUF3786 domain-containing protein n=1 Tax=Rhodocytophaga aerolata TaxID=455078 RepID=A0ABT8RIZ2_9BACT|nr:hypothetical protein [Rhodocytophaga aerolata]MDO1451969.1 hypothetical protein [Rhodocytophaga aerolata]
MANIKESIRTFKDKFLQQGIELKEAFNSLAGDAIVQVFYSQNRENESPLCIEKGNCHHVPILGIKFRMQSGRKILLYDSNSFSDYGGTCGIDIKELEVITLIEGQEEMSADYQWRDLVNVKIKYIKLIWLDDDGWEVPGEVNKSMGIFPHGIEMKFENGRTIFILVAEPDGYDEAEERYNYLRGGEELIIAFNEIAAKKQKLIIEGIDLEL